MKKAMLLIVAIITSFIYVNYASATVMYMECDYTSECEKIQKDGKNKASWAKRKCLINYGAFALFTDNKGNLDTVGLYFDDGELDDYKKVSNECWLEKFTNDTCDEDNNLYEKSDINKGRLLGTKTCPSGVVNEETMFGGDIIPVGKDGRVKKFSEITEPVFSIYSFNDGGEKKIIAEGYSVTGRYTLIGPDVEKSGTDEIKQYQLERIMQSGSDFWKVNLYNNKLITSSDETLKSLDGYNVCEGLKKSECQSKYKYKILIDSDDSNKELANNLTTWYNTQKKSMTELKSIAAVSKNSKLIKTSEELNKQKDKGEKYQLTSYTNGQLINELDSAYSNLKNAFKKSETKDYCTKNPTSPVSSAITYIYDKIGICEIKDLAPENDDEHIVNEGHIVESITWKIKKTLSTISNGEIDELLDATTKATEYIESFYKTILYLERDADEFGLTSSELETVKTLKEKYKNLIKDEGLNIAPVVSCKDLFGEDLVNKINSYLNIIKIAVPILLLIFGILDFLKAIFSDEDEMKKAQKKFMKRLGVALLIFLVPYLVNLLLKVANEVWPIISTDTCGIFE